MGEYSTICSLSGLAVEDGEPVRALLLTQSPYAGDPRNGDWVVRTPPLRAAYDGSGSIRRSSITDRTALDLWVRGVVEDVVLDDTDPRSTWIAAGPSTDLVNDLLSEVRRGTALAVQDNEHFWKSRPDLKDQSSRRFERHDFVDLYAGPERWNRPLRLPRLRVSLALVRDDVWSGLVVRYGLAAVRHVVGKTWQSVSDRSREARDVLRPGSCYFGDYLTVDHIPADPNFPSVWETVVHRKVPGAVGVPEHLATYLADQRDVPSTVLDSVAELAAVTAVMDGVGLIWRPSVASGPQSPSWADHEWFCSVVLGVARSRREAAGERALPTEIDESGP